MQEIADALNAKADPFECQVRIKGQLLQVQLLEAGHDNYIIADIARIRQDGGAYQVVWLNGPDNRESAEIKYDDLQKLIDDARQAIQARRNE